MKSALGILHLLADLGLAFSPFASVRSPLDALHCAGKHGLALIADGFELTIDDRASLVQDRLQGAL